MKIKVLGASGGKSKKSNLPSFLINNTILIDCGSVCSVLGLKEQLNINAIFISHSHFDHICDLPFLADNFSIAGKQVMVFGSKQTLTLLKNHIFNHTIWPDFTKIPSTEQPTITLKEVKQGEKIKVNGLEVEPFNVYHTEGSMGFIVSDGKTKIAYTSDTYKTNGLWDTLKGKGVKSIITECSFPSERKELANVSRHLSSASLKEEIKKMNGFEKIFIFHIKPHYAEKIKNDLSALNVHILKDEEELEV